MSSFAPQCGVNDDIIRIVSDLTAYFAVNADTIARAGSAGGPAAGNRR